MTLFKNLASIFAIVGVGGYFLQILMIAKCCDKHLNFQVTVFKITVFSMLLAFGSYILAVLTK